MSRTGRVHRGRESRALCWFAAGVLLVGGCSGGDDDEDAGGTESESGSDPTADTIESSPDETTSEIPVPAREATVIAIVGDAGELNDDTLAVAAVVDASAASAVFTVGDNEYTAEGRTVEAFAESVGGVYGRWIDAGAFYPIPGDHDYGDACDDDDADIDLDPYLEYFELPVGPEDETYYDVRIGDIHVFTIDSLVDCHRDGGAKLEREHQWLAQAASASDAALKIVLIHNPPYSSGTSHGSFEDLRWDYADWGVDLVVSGDDHIYERSVHDGVTYIVNGLGGIEAHELGDQIEGSQVLFADQFGVLFVASRPGRAAVSFVTIDDEEIDHFEIATDTESGVAPSASMPPVDTSVDDQPTLDVSTTWHWQLQGDVDTSFDVDVYDIDLFEATPELVEQLHGDGRTVICYFSAGSYEGWRPDADGYVDEDLGATLDGFEDERWLDVRSSTVRAVFSGRLERAVELGCDGVEPDNVDGYVNDTSFDLTADDQLDFNRFIADEAHDRSLLVGLKNDLDQIPHLLDSFDFAVNEQCHEFDECALNQPFLDAGKPVFNAEYADEFVNDSGEVCAASLELGLRTLILPLDLDGSFRISCDDT